MKSELKAKFLQHLTRKKGNQGFTLIELLVVIIIIGILSAIALPSFLNQSNKAKQSEAKQYVGTVTRTQQSYYMENNRFAGNLQDMSNPITGSTTNYNYGVTLATTDATQVLNTGTSKSNALRSYAGSTFVVTNATTSETNTVAIVCESNVPTTTAVAVGTVAGTTASCAGGSSPVK
jgi:type IV pilus assembly protein PilA